MAIRGRVAFFVMSWCTCSVWLQVLPILDNSHLGSLPRFQRIPCLGLSQHWHYPRKGLILQKIQHETINIAWPVCISQRV